MRGYLFEILIALDQLFNTMLGGWADETMSSHAWRLERDKKPMGRMRPAIDFFFGFEHCRRAYYAEKDRAYMDPEFRS